MQDIGKKHGLDNFEKIKEEGVLEQVCSCSPNLVHMPEHFVFWCLCHNEIHLQQCGWLVYTAAVLFLLCSLVVLGIICQTLLQYTKNLEDLRKYAEEDMDVAKRKDGLDWVNIDPAQLKPKLT